MSSLQYGNSKKGGAVRSLGLSSILSLCLSQIPDPGMRSWFISPPDQVKASYRHWILCARRVDGFHSVWSRARVSLDASLVLARKRKIARCCDIGRERSPLTLAPEVSTQSSLEGEKRPDIPCFIAMTSWTGRDYAPAFFTAYQSIERSLGTLERSRISVSRKDWDFLSFLWSFLGRVS